MAFFSTAASVLGGASALGGLLGGGNKNGGAGVVTDTKAPWEPAQKYLLQNLETNKQLQDYYAQNPFSDTQKTQYQGLLDTLANNQAAGSGLLNWASNFGQSKRGVMPEMTALPTGTKAAAIDWEGMNPYKQTPAAAPAAQAPAAAAPGSAEAYIEYMKAQQAFMDQQGYNFPTMDRG